MSRHQWLLIVAISFGLVGMHHLVHADTDHTTPMATAPAAHTGHADPDPAAPNPGEAQPTSASIVAPQAGCCDPMDMVGHFCLAVLTAITALTAALTFAAVRRRLLEPGDRLATISAVAARAPPIGCAQLTQLCVLRR